MKIGGNRPPVAPALPVTGRTSAAASAAAASGGAAPDSVSVMGIPEAELTPRVRAAIAGLMAEADRLRQELESANGRLAAAMQLADQDPLTGVLNRRAFVRELSRAMAYSDRYGVPASLVYFDLDDFKRLNDAFGHAAGDAALVHFAEVLSANTRESDVVGRLGGDEFAVILAKAEHDVALRKAESLAAAIRAIQPLADGRALRIGFSFGAVAFRSGASASDALKEADRAMYAHKRARRAPDAS